MRDMKAALFKQVRVKKPSHNRFDLSHDLKLSCKFGDLVPVMVLEAVPGDKFNVKQQSLTRLAPMVTPTMHEMNVTYHSWFVPYRIIWPGWEDYITQTTTGGVLPAHPVFEYDESLPAEAKKLCDYLGLPSPLVGADPEIVSALPLAAYAAIYSEWYRDQNQIAEIDYKLPDGTLDTSSTAILNRFFKLRKRAYEHDYFTSALPQPQAGAAVDIPLGDVTLKDDWYDPSNPTIMPHFKDSTDAVPVAGDLRNQNTLGTGWIDSTGDPADPLAYDPNGTLEVGSTTINTLRRAFRLQEFLEKLARGGKRYVEYLKSVFNVNSSDKRLQRPEYITGSRSPISISEVLNTSDTANAPQGNMAGHGLAVVDGAGGSYYCEEHGFIITLMNVQPRTAYFQGIPKHWLKHEDPYQYYIPDFANIGEQEILNKELYAFQGATGSATFGYTPRYAEYKYQPGRVSGDFRTTLNPWHMARTFDSPPALNQEFIECDGTDPSNTRIFAVQSSEDYLWMHIYNQVSAIRPMPKFGTPTI